MAELRWILSGLGAVAIAAIWWWSTRRSSQAPGNAELRESTVARPPESRERPAESRERAPAPGMRPLEPLSMRASDFDRVPVLDMPMMAAVDPVHIETDESDEPAPGPPADAPLLAEPAPKRVAPPMSPGRAEPPTITAVVAEPAPKPVVPPAAQTSPPPRPGVEGAERSAAGEPRRANGAERQKIVALRVCAVGDARWPGTRLMAALEAHGLAYGKYQVYHRNHSDGSSIYCVASLVEPGTFDLSRMPEDEFRGVSLFAVLPGPLEPLQTVDALLATARDLARELSGTVQDAKGVPFSPQRAAALREDVARFALPAAPEPHP